MFEESIEICSANFVKCIEYLTLLMIKLNHMCAPMRCFILTCLPKFVSSILFPVSYSNILHDLMMIDHDLICQWYQMACQLLSSENFNFNEISEWERMEVIAWKEKLQVVAMNACLHDNVHCCSLKETFATTFDYFTIGKSLTQAR